MIVICEECQTRFTVDENIIDKEGSKAQCSVCGNMFTIYPDPIEDSIDDLTDTLLLDEEFGEDYKDKKIGYGTLAVIVILVILGASVVLELSGIDVPLLKGITFKGKSIDKKENISNKQITSEKSYISIFDMKADIINNEKIGKLFIITGKAKNNFTDSISSILITANLYDANNNIIKTKDIFCGNIISQKGLQTYSIDEINKALNNSQNQAEINPNEQVDFMAVFFDFPKNPGKFDIVVKELRQTQSNN